MDLPNPNIVNLLDKIRINDGIAKLEDFFYNLMRSEPRTALNMVNDMNLRFTSLFILQPGLGAPELYDKLSARNKIVLRIMSGIQKRSAADIEELRIRSGQIPQAVLRWMLQTGRIDDGLSSSYDAMLDSAAILLVKLFNDKTVIHDIIELIFSRYRRKSYSNDLVWAFLEYRDPYTLVQVADHLLSGSESDTKLVCKLLGFLPFIEYRSSMDSDSSMNGQKLYTAFFTWFQNNSRFLYYTGENFQQTSRPAPYAVSREYKYLCRTVWADSRDIAGLLSEDESMLLEKFMDLDHYTKALLSDYSFLLRQQGLQAWRAWLHRPVSEQLAEAADRMGVIL